MKISLLTFSVFMLISQFQLIGQNNNFEITKIGEHGFCRNGDMFYYKLDVEIKNNTNLKLKRTEFCPSLNQLFFRDCSKQIYDSIWHPKSVIKFEIFIRSDSYYGITESSFDRTPENILLSIKINAHNIDKDFDELVSKYDVKDDWIDFQKVLGLRDIEPGEELKIINPPAETITNNKTDDTNTELEKRKVIYQAKPIYPKWIYEEGLIMVEVTVNRDGIVTQAKAGIKGSTNMHGELLEASKNAALQTRYNPEPNAPEYQLEILSYNYRLGN